MQYFYLMYKMLNGIYFYNLKLKQIIFILCLLLISCNNKKTTVYPPQDVATIPIETDTLRLLFVGDVMQHLPQVEAARTINGYDYSACFRYVKSEVSAADIAVVNLETTLGGKPYKGYPCFSSPDELLQSLKSTGFDVIATANNHCVDRGRKGLERTNARIDSLHLSRMGTYKNRKERDNRYPLLLKIKGFRVCFLNYTYGTNGIPVTAPNVVNLMDTTEIAADIVKAKRLNPDVIIAYVHWGEEYRKQPNETQRLLANMLINKGVHHIIGSHPHVVQPIQVHEREDGTRHLVAYSLGNYISNQSDRGTDGGITLTLELVKDSVTRLHRYWHRAVWVARPAVSGRKNYQLIPDNLSQGEMQSLPHNARMMMQTFFDDTQNLLRKGVK